ncbi:hypothetical protein [Shinella zoogloeoides]
MAKSFQKANRGKALRQKNRIGPRLGDVAAGDPKNEKAAGPPGNVGVSLQRRGGFVGAPFSSASIGPLWTFPKQSRKRASLETQQPSKQIQRLGDFPGTAARRMRQPDLFKSWAKPKS